MSRPDLSFLFQNWNPDEHDEDASEQLHAGDTGSAPLASKPSSATARDPMTDLVNELRNYQFELETQNKVLRFSQAAAESASERFEALFASVPLSLMVLDEHDMVVQANSMAHRSFQPTENDRPLTELQPFVSPEHAQRVQQAFALAHPDDLIWVTGSLYLIGDIREYWFPSAELLLQAEGATV